MKQKFRITLEVEVDPTAFTDGLQNGSPGRWNWQGISKIVEIPDVQVTVQDYFVACCEEKIEWYLGRTDVIPTEFPAHSHDESCVNHKPVEDEDD
jgi:hypothetical protein